MFIYYSILQRQKDIIISFDVSLYVLYSTIYIYWDVLSKLISIVENNNDIDLKLYLEFLVFYRCTWVNLWEQHVRWDFQILDAVTVSNLDVLHFSSLCFIFKCLNTYKLDLHWLNLQLWVSLDNEAVERFIEAAVRGGNDTIKLKLRNRCSCTCF